ncbi:MAG: starch-binding protein, partial [Muribaculaceae bacterium]|nr:starch-binding protein [Muribaculaceae bacterium]
NGLYNGTIMSDFRRVTLNSNNTSKTYYYKHFDNDAVTGGALGFLVSFNGDTDKSADTNLPKPGNYFFDYNGTPGAVLTDNSSSYWSTTTSNTGNNTVNENGINLYVRSTDGSAPYLHTWTGSNNAPRRVAIKTTGNDKPALYIPEVTQVINNTTWYYVHSDESSLNFLVAADGAYGHQSSNQTVTAGGVKFYTYNPSNGNIEDKTSDFYTIQGATPTPSTTGKITVLVRDMSNDNAIPYMHYWGTGNDSSAPVQLTDYVTIDGHNWYYKQFNSLTGVIIAQNSSWGNQTSNMDNATVGINYSTGNYYFLEYYPGGSGWKCNPNNSSNYIPLLPTSGGTQVINFTQTTRLTTSNALYTEESGTAATDTSDPLPSCATYVPGNQPYFYFENDGHFIMPCAWVWNGTSVFSGHSWPGEQLVEMVGTANNGNTVYRWLYDGENTSTPQSVIFNDNGSNSTGTFTYERGAYYNTSGKVGVVTNSTVSLADLVKYGVSGEKYTIANDLVCAYVNMNGEYLFAKDNAGDAILQSYKTEGQLDYNYYQNKEDYDQSNWIKIKLPDATGTTAIDKFGNRVLLSGTVIGTFTLENGNPMITVQAHPVVGKPSFYTPNIYIPTNFTGDNNYYFITPKPQEYCKVIWAVYNSSNNTFSVPEKCVIDGVSINNADLSGTFDAVIDSEFNDSGITLSNNHIYELTGVVQTKQNILRQAPRRTEIYPHSGEASPTYSFVMTGATDKSDEIVTHVGNQIGDRTVESVTYFNVMGVASKEPMDGINIVVTRYSNGTSSSHKIIKR